MGLVGEWCCNVTVMWPTNLLFLCCNLHYCVCVCVILLKPLMHSGVKWHEVRLRNSKLARLEVHYICCTIWLLIAVKLQQKLWFMALSLHKVHHVGHIFMALPQANMGCKHLITPSIIICVMILISWPSYSYSIFLMILRHYPYHYAPFMSDLNQFSGQPLKEFELGEPMFPLHQELAMSHPASSVHLPKAYQVADTIQLLT